MEKVKSYPSDEVVRPKAGRLGARRWYLLERIGMRWRNWWEEVAKPRSRRSGG
jgi:hypothetical protein